MILCSCTCLRRADLAEASAAMLAEDPEALLTPNRVFHRTGRRIRCGECRTLVAAHLADAREGAADGARPCGRAAPCRAVPPPQVQGAPLSGPVAGPASGPVSGPAPGPVSGPAIAAPAHPAPPDPARAIPAAGPAPLPAPTALSPAVPAE